MNMPTVIFRTDIYRYPSQQYNKPKWSLGDIFDSQTVIIFLTAAICSGVVPQQPPRSTAPIA